MSQIDYYYLAYSLDLVEYALNKPFRKTIFDKKAE